MARIAGPRRALADARADFLDLDSLSKLRAEQDKLPAPRCGGGVEAAHKLGESTATLKTLLPETPNERLVYDCRVARGG